MAYCSCSMTSFGGIFVFLKNTVLLINVFTVNRLTSAFEICNFIWPQPVRILIPIYVNCLPRKLRTPCIFRVSMSVSLNWMDGRTDVYMYDRIVNYSPKLVLVYNHWLFIYMYWQFSKFFLYVHTSLIFTSSFLFCINSVTKNVSLTL